MLKPSVFGIAVWQEQGHRIIDHLKSVSFANSAVSAFFPDNGVEWDTTRSCSCKAGEKALTGGCVGEELGWMAGAGQETGWAAIPEPEEAEVPADVIVMGLAAMGIPFTEALRYRSLIRNGHILIAVHTITFEDVLLAREILANNGAQDICITGQCRTAPVTDAGPIWRPQSRQDLVPY